MSQIYFLIVVFFWVAVSPAVASNIREVVLLPQLHQISWISEVQGDENYTNAVAKSQFEIAKFIMSDLETPLFVEGQMFDINPDNISIWDNYALSGVSLFDLTARVFQKGLPVDFSSLTKIQKEYLRDFGASNFLLFTGAKKYIYATQSFDLAQKAKEIIHKVKTISKDKVGPYMQAEVAVYRHSVKEVEAKAVELTIDFFQNNDDQKKIYLIYGRGHSRSIGLRFKARDEIKFTENKGLAKVADQFMPASIAGGILVMPFKSNVSFENTYPDFSSAIKGIYQECISDYIDARCSKKNVLLSGVTSGDFIAALTNHAMKPVEWVNLIGRIQGDRSVSRIVNKAIERYVLFNLEVLEIEDINLLMSALRKYELSDGERKGMGFAGIPSMDSMMQFNFSFAFQPDDVTQRVYLYKMDQMRGDIDELSDKSDLYFEMAHGVPSLLMGNLYIQFAASSLRSAGQLNYKKALLFAKNLSGAEGDYSETKDHSEEFKKIIEDAMIEEVRTISPVEFLADVSSMKYSVYKNSLVVRYAQVRNKVSPLSFTETISLMSALLNREQNYNSDYAVEVAEIYIGSPGVDVSISVQQISELLSPILYSVNRNSFIIVLAEKLFEEDRLDLAFSEALLGNILNLEASYNVDIPLKILNLLIASSISNISVDKIRQLSSWIQVDYKRESFLEDHSAK